MCDVFPCVDERFSRSAGLYRVCSSMEFVEFNLIVVCLWLVSYSLALRLHAKSLRVSLRWSQLPNCLCLSTVDVCVFV